LLYCPLIVLHKGGIILNSSLRISFVALLAITLLFSGCAAFRMSNQDVQPEDLEHYRADYDASDMRKITTAVVDKILTSPFLSAQSSPPVMTIAGVENRTREYVDTKNLTDKMRTMLLQSGKMQFVNTARRKELLDEQGYQAANANPDQMAVIGAQAGAKYMITGSLTQMTQQTGKQVRVSKQRLNYYKLTMEITDLTSSLIIWTTEEEFARNESIPLIGW
jgi:penicillin-binding protein activator